MTDHTTTTDTEAHCMEGDFADHHVWSYPGKGPWPYAGQPCQCGQQTWPTRPGTLAHQAAQERGFAT